MHVSILEALNEKWAVCNVVYVEDKVCGTRILLNSHQIGWLMTCSKIPHGGYTFRITKDDYKPDVSFDTEEEAKLAVNGYIVSVIDKAAGGYRRSAHMPEIFENKFFADLAANQKPTPPDIQKTIDDYFWEMLTGETPNEVKTEL